MKKIYLISGIAVFFGLLFTFRPHWLRFMWGWQILLIPLFAGVMMIIVQQEKKSYRFLPKLIIGSLLTAFSYALVLQITEYFKYYDYFEKPFLWFVNFYKIIPFTLFLAVVCFFGGLIGIVIKGIYLLLKDNKKYEKI